MGICRLFGSGLLEAQSTVLALTYPHCCTSRFRARPFRHIGAAPSVADALPRRERVMLNSSRDEATRRRDLALARFAPLRELTPARGIRLERSPEGTRLRRRRAHDVASVLGLLHMDGFGR